MVQEAVPNNCEMRLIKIIELDKVSLGVTRALSANGPAPGTLLNTVRS